MKSFPSAIVAWTSVTSSSVALYQAKAPAGGCGSLLGAPPTASEPASPCGSSFAPAVPPSPTLGGDPPSAARPPSWESVPAAPPPTASPGGHVRLSLHVAKRSLQPAARAALVPNRETQTETARLVDISIWAFLESVAGSASAALPQALDLDRRSLRCIGTCEAPVAYFFALASQRQPEPTRMAMATLSGHSRRAGRTVLATL